MVTVWTGRIGEGGDTEVNTTMGSASTPIGKVLAPTRALVLGHKAFRGDTRFKDYSPIDDDAYREGYLQLIRSRFRANQTLFRTLLERDEITVTCYCGKDKHYCHRFIIARHILPKCAEYFGIDYHYAGER
ncbi:MAG: hypothetical protein AAFU54_19105 [Chloroflexota bacterium]